MGDEGRTGPVNAGQPPSNLTNPNHSASPHPAGSMGPPASVPRLRPSQPRSAVSNKIKTLLDSQKIIKGIISKSSDIAQYLVEENNLKNAIESLFTYEDQETKVSICNLHFASHLRSAGDLVVAEMQAAGHFDLDNFLEKVYQMTFPSAPVVMECTFKNIRQKSDETIVEYGRRFQLFCSKLDRALQFAYTILKIYRGPVGQFGKITPYKKSL